MHIVPKESCTGATIDSLYSEVNQLQAKYEKLLGQEGLEDDIQALKISLEKCKNGSSEAADYLREHGKDVLNNVKERLKAALIEQERIVEESPAVAQRSDGKQAHIASRATALADKAHKKVDDAIEEIDA